MQHADAIAILGAGSWGTALAVHLAHNDQTVHLWDINRKRATDIQQQRCNQQFLPGVKLPSSIIVNHDLEAIVKNSTDIICAVPSHAFRSTMEQCQQYLQQSKRIAWVSKGVDPTSCCLLSTIVQDIFGDIPAAALSGPSFASEVSKQLPTAIVIGADQKHQDFADDLINRFNHQYFRVYHCHDMIGVQLGGALKNIYAIAAGISDGLGFGANARCGLITRGLAEMSRLGTAMGAQQQTFMGLAGLGDLILTCTDNQSRNRRFGLALGQGKSIEQAEQEIKQVVEGKGMAQYAGRLAEQFAAELPIANQVNSCLHGNSSPQQALETLFARKTKMEF